MNETKLKSHLIGANYYESYTNKEGREVNSGYKATFLTPYNDYEKKRGARGFKAQTANFNKEQTPLELDMLFKSDLDKGVLIPVNVYYVVESLDSMPRFTRIEKA